MPQSRVSLRSDSTSEANSSCCHRSDDAWSHLEWRVVSSGKSLIYSRKSVGPRMEPWETPALTAYSCEDFSSRTTQSGLLVRIEKLK